MVQWKVTLNERKQSYYIGDTPVFHWTMIMGKKGKPCQQIHSLLGGGNSNIFWNVHPEIWGRVPFWRAYFPRPDRADTVETVGAPEGRLGNTIGTMPKKKKTVCLGNSLWSFLSSGKSSLEKYCFSSRYMGQLCQLVFCKATHIWAFPFSVCSSF